ncbi:uncharacterized protein EAF02_008318 [Botrytis sinoallii]|uniref:uncharacterized protein n=1 Tax=Botrytis sinoallii TaxID=1463999 RepID=UPI001900F25F|nr:uncharacterized protein EAF02_008318 [Botrytis sinoallii]KAF7877098.1 hypothetical protein EAF02_008318 [Botrytis sinoallii]
MGAIKLDGGVALITGAGSVIGKETAFTLAEAGASAIVFADIDEAKIKEAVEESKKLATDAKYQALAIGVDVTEAESVQSLIETTVKAFGRADYCVNSAGIDVDAYIPFNDSVEATYDKVMDTNAKGAYLVTRAASKQMASQEPRVVAATRGRERNLGRGSIVNVGSALSYGAVPYKVGYVTSKHALLGITKASAVEAGPAGVRVNLVCPSWVATPMFIEECNRAPPTADFIKAAVSTGRPAEAGEVAEGISFLCSSAATYINGVGLLIDAGLTLTVHLE